MKQLSISKFAIAASLILTTFIQVPATAVPDATFGIAVSQTSRLFDGQAITVRAQNLPSDKGIYVLQCLLTAGIPDYPKNCTSLQSNPKAVLWISTSQGASNPSVANPFAVVRTINSNDCSTLTCGLVTVRDHMASHDRSFDTVTPLSFSTIVPMVNKTSNLLDAGDTLSISLSGLEANTGAYVRLCQLPNDDSKPTMCDGDGVWASTKSQNIAYGATDATKSFNLAVRGTFSKEGKMIDCQIVSCGLFLMRDHENFQDRSLDTYIPVTFANPIKLIQSVSKWNVSPGSHSIKVSGTVTLANTKAVTNRGTTVSWTSNSPSICKLSIKGTAQRVTGVKAGQCTISAQAVGSSRLLPVTYTWKFKVIR